MVKAGTGMDFDAVVVGVGFGGIYMLKKLRDELGLSVRAYDKAGGVGGTWFWNRYPGAMSDSHTHVYCYSFDKELLRERPIETKYVMQPEVLKYLEDVVQRHDLAKDIQLGTGMIGASYDEQQGIWRIRLDSGESITARFLVTALGLLSQTNIPAFPGIENFVGETYHTGSWPADVDLAGKRVGVIGTGSTGIQVITEVAPTVGHLTVFQRSPQYSVPAGNGPVSREQSEQIKRDYDAIWNQVRGSVVAFGFEESTVPAMSVSAEERRLVFQEAWDKGNGFNYMFGTFCDIATDDIANEEAAAFVRSKIAEIVTDPETARKLTPTEPYAKRPLCDSGYFEQFNRDNVELVHIGENPIAEIVPSGVRTVDGIIHEVDVLIYATGFDAVDGCYKVLDIRGRGGKSMKDHWSAGPTSLLGVATHDFPNLFMVLGPHGPFTNLPPTIEVQVEWITELIAAAREPGMTVEALVEHEDQWCRTCHDLAHETVFPKVGSWIFGANIPGKPNVVTFYMAGLGAYRQVLSESAENEYRGFRFAPSAITSS